MIKYFIQIVTYNTTHDVGFRMHVIDYIARTYVYFKGLFRQYTVLYFIFKFQIYNIHSVISALAPRAPHRSTFRVELRSVSIHPKYSFL